MRYNIIRKMDISNGPGMRVSIFMQGCDFHCKNCFNSETWSFNGGGLIPVKAVLDEIDKLEYHTGLTLSGGDPMYQVEPCLEIVKYAKNKGLNIWVYTGFTWEELMKLNEKNPIYLEFLKEIDVLVDGRFILEERDLSLLFRGSRNQRLIDVQKTLKNNKISLLDEYKYNEEELFKKEPMFI